MFNLSTILSASYQRHLKMILLVTVISGCGFQPRGLLDMSAEISPLYLQQNSVFELGRELKLLLATNRISLTDDLTRSNAQITLLGEEKSRRVLTVDGDGRAREYLLMYTVKFSVNINQPENKEVKDSISLSRSLLFNTDAVLAVTNESEVLYKDMQRNAARLILLKLQARARADSTSIDVSAVSQSSSKVH
ncbi:MAG: hypothetical protein KAJ32_07250 [Gammaproteobacteria bacterium]|nr:hypothetical protein [Gammaproteobacteria bacterium]